MPMAVSQLSNIRYSNIKYRLFLCLCVSNAPAFNQIDQRRTLRKPDKLFFLASSEHLLLEWMWCHPGSQYPVIIIHPWFRSVPNCGAWGRGERPASITSVQLQCWCNKWHILSDSLSKAFMVLHGRESLREKVTTCIPSHLCTPG